MTPETKLPDEIIVGLSNHFSPIRLRKLEGQKLSSTEEEGVEAYESLIRWLYPPPEMSKEEREIFDLAREILKNKSK